MAMITTVGKWCLSKSRLMDKAAIRVDVGDT